MGRQSFEEILERDGKLVYKARGFSMKPMLHEDRDLVVIVPPASRLKPLDVAFYRRDGKYVLHRVISVSAESYDIRGDNTYCLEHIPDTDVIGVLSAFVRGGKVIPVTDKIYQRYVRFWCGIYPMRLLYFKSVQKLKKLSRAAGLTPLLKKLIRHG